MKYQSLHILLTAEQRSSFKKLISTGKAPAKEIRRANILLLADESNGRKRTKDKDIASMLNVSVQTINTVKKTFINSSEPEKTVQRKKRETPPVPGKITGDLEAKITQIACSAPPEGHSRWTLRLIADKAVELEYVDSISHTAVGTVLKKTGLSLT
mgnify:CR=1 FL=1